MNDEDAVIFSSDMQDLSRVISCEAEGESELTLFNASIQDGARVSRM